MISIERGIDPTWSTSGPRHQAVQKMSARTILLEMWSVPQRIDILWGQYGISEITTIPSLPRVRGSAGREFAMRTPMQAETEAI